MYKKHNNTNAISFPSFRILYNATMQHHCTMPHILNSHANTCWGHTIATHPTEDGTASGRGDAHSWSLLALQFCQSPSRVNSATQEAWRHPHYMRFFFILKKKWLLLFCMQRILHWPVLLALHVNKTAQKSDAEDDDDEDAGTTAADEDDNK